MDIQSTAQQVIDELVDADRETGLQVAVYAEGRLADSAAAGIADPASGRPVAPGSLLFQACPPA